MGFYLNPLYNDLFSFFSNIFGYTFYELVFFFQRPLSSENSILRTWFDFFLSLDSRTLYSYFQSLNLYLFLSRLLGEVLSFVFPEPRTSQIPSELRLAPSSFSRRMGLGSNMTDTPIKSFIESVQLQLKPLFSQTSHLMGQLFDIRVGCMRKSTLPLETKVLLTTVTDGNGFDSLTTQDSITTLGTTTRLARYNNFYLRYNFKSGVYIKSFVP